jgi:nicotinate-nucleotide adenylyltransferase
VRVGLFGGTFDPPHTGHLIVAQDAALALRLDRILFIPAAQPPHKRLRVVTPAPIRARMLEIAIAGDERFAMDRIELDRAGPSFTVDTLRELHAREPSVEWALLIGADQYDEFDTWREPEVVRELARICVLERAGSGAASAAASGGGGDAAGAGYGAERVAVTRIDISSTAIRARVAAGLSIRYLVPEAVEAFILEERLYGGNGTVAAGYESGRT